MNTSALKKWEGLLSVFWALIGFALFEYWEAHHEFTSLFTMFLAVFVAWWGVSLLFAICGLRSGSRVSALAGCATILGFLYFLWWAFVPHFHT
jgi:cytosine/uracil/thiamine/allantoin permease